MKENTEFSHLCKTSGLPFFSLSAAHDIINNKDMNQVSVCTCIQTHFVEYTKNMHFLRSLLFRDVNHLKLLPEYKIPL